MAKMASNGPQMIPNNPQTASNDPKMAPKDPKTAPRMTPKNPKDFQWSRSGLKPPPNGPKWSQNCLQNEPQMTRNESPNAPEVAQMSQNVPKCPQKPQKAPNGAPTCSKPKVTTPSLSPSIAWKKPLGEKNGILGQGKKLGLLGSIWCKRQFCFSGESPKMPHFVGGVLGPFC